MSENEAKAVPVETAPPEGPDQQFLNDSVFCSPENASDSSVFEIEEIQFMLDEFDAERKESENEEN